MNDNDIFHWANKIDGVKSELDIELFLFNKNYTPYSTRMTTDIVRTANAMFLFDIVNFISMGAAAGLKVVAMDAASKDKMTLPFVPIRDVSRAETLIHLIETERDSIVEFSSSEHEFKSVKGIVARYTHPSDKNVQFYVIKQLKPSTVVSGANAWSFESGEFRQQVLDASLRMPLDNQVLIVGGEVFVFNRSKFESLFNYNAEMIALAKAKGGKIDSHFKLSMPTTINEFEHFARPSAVNIRKLLEVDTDNLMDQEQVIATADDMQLELMTDDAGAIILMDSNDVNVFLDIINDNYVRGMTGNSYLVKKKQPLIVVEDE